MGTEDTKIESGVMIIKTNNEDYYQVILNEEQFDWVISLIVKLHEGHINLLDKKLENISF